MLDPDQVASLSDAQETLLRQQEITRERPGPILQDVDMMLDCVGEDGLRVSASRGTIYTKVLPDINERLSYSLTTEYDRLTQTAFPTIAGLNLLLRAAGLVRIDRTGTHPHMRLNESVVASWHDLNSTEQYMGLLEAWLNRADEDAIFEKSGRSFMSSFIGVLTFIQDIPPTGWAPDDGELKSVVRYRPGSANLALMWLFGLVDLEQRGTAAGQPWRIDRIALPAFGKTLLRRLGHALSQKQEAVRAEQPPEQWWDFDVGQMRFTRDELHHILAPYFPEWDSHLSGPHEAFRPDVHVFEVQLYDACRWRVAVPGSATLHELSECLLSAARFDREHLYQFLYEDPYGHEQTVNDGNPYGLQEPPFADEVEVGELPLAPGETMTFLYDLGDRWRFECTLDTVGGDAEVVNEPVVMDAEGDPPEQYSGSDGWW